MLISDDFAHGIDVLNKYFFLQKERELMMKLTKNLGTVLLALWLVLTGLTQLVEMPIPSLNMIMAVLAIAAGVLMFMNK